MLHLTDAKCFTFLRAHQNCIVLLVGNVKKEKCPVSDIWIVLLSLGENRGPPLVITLTKDGAGLGFSLEGGKESPLGDKPLTIKKIFTGTYASRLVTVLLLYSGLVSS
jgi:hypothetical protein